MKVKLVCTQCQSEIGTIDKDFTLQFDKTNNIHIHLSNTKQLKKGLIDKEKEKSKKRKKKKYYLLCPNNHKVGSEFVDGSCLVDGTETSVLKDNKLTTTANWKKTQDAKPFLKPFVETIKEEKKEIKKKQMDFFEYSELLNQKRENLKNGIINEKEKKINQTQKSKIPTNPPFLAFVGNLPLTVTKEDLKIFEAIYKVRVSFLNSKG
jgi:hypothetical protein